MNAEIKKMILESLMKEMGDADIKRFKPKEASITEVEEESEPKCEICDDKGCKVCDMDEMESEDYMEEDASMSDFMKAVMAAKKKTLDKTSKA